MEGFTKTEIIVTKIEFRVFNIIAEGKEFKVYLFILVIYHFGFLMSLEPHHILGVEPPTLLLEGLGRQVLGLGSLHVIEDEEECLRGQLLEEVDRITSRGWSLGIVRGCVAGVSRQVGPQSLRITGVWQVVGCSLQHAKIINIDQIFRYSRN